VLFRKDRWRDCSGSDVGGLTRAECRGARASVSKAQLTALDMRPTFPGVLEFRPQLGAALLSPQAHDRKVRETPLRTTAAI
jgi:hypothetical protein